MFSRCSPLFNVTHFVHIVLNQEQVNMPGYKKSKIVGWKRRDLKEFVCAICKGVLNKPVFTQCCRQSYCGDCIEEWLKGHDTCPNDKQPLTIDGVSEVPRLVINVINNMRIKCDYSNDGCDEVITIGTKVEHVQMCKFKDMKSRKVFNSENTQSIIIST